MSKALILRCSLGLALALGSFAGCGSDDSNGGSGGAAGEGGPGGSAGSGGGSGGTAGSAGDASLGGAAGAAGAGGGAGQDGGAGSAGADAGLDAGDGAVEADAGCTDGTGAGAWKEIATLGTQSGVTPKLVDGMVALAATPNTLLVGTNNVGSTCGGGTGAAVWRVTLDPATGLATSVTLQQSLSLSQSLRSSLFESSGGTLFTGGGWCGPTPPYYSTNSGATFTAATNGVHPPNSSFAYAEHKGEIYLGTGYQPFAAEVYHWLGNGSWELMHTLPAPRGIANALAVDSERLFVGTDMYGWNTAACASSVPVVMSTDGTTFQPTTGIPGCDQVFAIEVVADKAYAFTEQGSSGVYEVHGWNKAQLTWELIGAIPSNLGLPQRPLIATHGDRIYFYARYVPTGVTRAIYSSKDGAQWDLVTEVPSPVLSHLVVSSDTLYAGSEAESGAAHVYSLGLCP